MARKADTKNLKDRNGTWWLWARRGGMMLRRSLRTSDLATAQRERDRILAPLNLRDEADRARALADAAKSAEDRAAKAIEDAARREGLAVADAWQAFVDSKTRRPCAAVTLEDYRQRWEAFTRWWADYAPDRPKLADVAAVDAETFARFLEGEALSPNRANKIIQTCRRLYNTLARQVDGENPFGATSKSGIANAPQDTQSRRPLSEGELRAICGQAEGELRTLLALGMFTGQRLGDCVLLPWHDVDLGRGIITFTPRKTRSRTGKVIAVPVHPVLKAILEETPSAERAGDVLPDFAARHRKDRASVSKTVLRHFAACGIEDAAPPKTATPGKGHRRPLVGFHSLRHSFVSLCAEGGVPLAVVQHLVGHGSPAMTRHYSHIGQAAAGQAIAALPDVTRNALPEADTAKLSAGEALAAIRAALTATSDHGPLFKAIEKIINTTEVRS